MVGGGLPLLFLETIDQQRLGSRLLFTFSLSLSLSFTAQVYYPRNAKNTETPKTDVKIALGVTESEGLRANRALKEGLRAK